MANQIKTINITTSSILRILAVVLGVVIFFKIWQIIASLFLAIVVASALEPTLRWLSEHKISRMISVPAIYLLSFGALVGVFYALLPTLFNEIFIISQDFTQKYEIFIQKFFQKSTFGSLDFLIPAIDVVFVNIQDKLASLIPDIFSFVSILFGGILSFVLVLLFSFYFSLRKNQIERSILSITPENHKDYVKDLVRRMQRRVGGWLQASFVLATFMGIAVFIILSLLNVKFALTLGVIAGFLEIIPFIGPIVTGIIILLIASTQSLVLGIITLGLYILLQQLQQAFVVPVVMSRVIGVNPLFLLVAVIIGVELAGVWGILISVPLVAATAELVRDATNKRNKK